MSAATASDADDEQPRPRKPSEIKIPDEDEGVHHDGIQVQIPSADKSKDNLETDSTGAASVQGWEANYMEDAFEITSLFPPLKWFPVYVRSMIGRSSKEELKILGNLPYSLKDDLIAGTTVGVMLVPQCLAFALLAGLPVQVGLYSSFAPLVVYALFGTIRQVQPGPTALVSLLTGGALNSMGLEDDAERMSAAALLAFVVGIVSLFLGVIRFGFIVDFMSHSVMAAFCTAAGITIATSQLKHLFGIDLPKTKKKEHWWQTAHSLVSHFGEANPATAVLGIALLALLFGLKSWKSAGSRVTRIQHPIWRFFPCEPTSKSFFAMKLVADMSTLLAVIIGWFWAWFYRAIGVTSVKIVGEVDSSGFVLRFPDSIVESLTTSDSLILSGMVIAVVGFLETVAVGGKFAAKARYTYQPNQELIALGLANLAGGMMSGFPVTGSFSRTAVNAMLGATSLLACATSSVIVLLAVLFLLPIISYMPLAALAPIIIVGAVGVIDKHSFKVAWRANRKEFGIMLMTLVVSLYLSVKEGLLVGFTLSVGKMMHDLANPNMAICGQLPDGTFRDVRNFPQAMFLPHVVVLRMDARLIFSNSRKMKEFCARAVRVRELHGEHIEFCVIDGKSMNSIDLTGCEALEALAEDLHGCGTNLVVANLKGLVSKCLTAARVPESLDKVDGHLCIDMEHAMAIVTHKDDSGKAASEHLRTLVERVDAAQLHLQLHKGGLGASTSGSPSARSPSHGSRGK